MALANRSRRRRHHQPTSRSGRSAGRRDGRDASTRDRLDASLLTLMDAALAACILIVPFLMGGRHPIGQLALVALTSVVVVAWALRQAVDNRGKWRPTHASLILMAGLVLIAFQLTPLPQAWLARCSPQVAQLLPLWGPDVDTVGRLGGWNRISLTPEQTRAGLMLFCCYSLLFLATVQRVACIEDVERILRWCALAAVLMAGFGLVQYFASNGKYFWFYQAPYMDTDRSVTGAFTNRNHFAHFLALGIGPVVWWLYRLADRRGEGRWTRGEQASGLASLRRPLLVLAAVLVLFAGLLSLSRGGSTVLLLAAVIAAVVCGRAVAMQGRFLIGIVAVGVLVIGLLNCFGLDRVSQRLGTISSGSIEQLDKGAGRRRVWKAVATAIPDFALFGTGVGSHREICPTYLTDPVDGFVFTHAESSHLQSALETGLVGATLIAAGIGFCGFWCVAGMWRGRSSRAKACLGAIGASLAASVVHAVADFVWYVPACMALVAVLAALACRCWQMSRPSGQEVPAWRMPRAVALAVGVFVVVVSIDMLDNRFRATVAQHYLDRTAIAVCEASRQTSQQRDLTAPENRHRELEREERMLADLKEAVRWYPEHARAHLSLARCHLYLFDLRQLTSPNPMPLTQIRDAAIASRDRFPSREARDEWMQRAFGDHCEHLYWALRHTRASLRCCPLEGRAYLFLAELGFLEGDGRPEKQACLDQALRVRPFDGGVLDMAAREMYEAILTEDFDAWVALARRTMGSEWSAKKRFIDNMVRYMPPEALGAFFELVATELKPDLEGVELLYRAAKPRATDEQLRPLRQYVAEMARFEAEKVSGREKSRRLMLACKHYRELGDQEESLRCARAAYESDPSEASVRYVLACRLLETGAGDEAQSHLLWCLRRDPNNAALQRKYHEAVAAAARQAAETASRDVGATR